MTYEEKASASSDNVYFGIQWNESNTATTFSVKPTIYRWDRQSTDNSGGRWSEDITKTSGSGVDSWSGISFVAGSGYRVIDTFSSKRTYTKGTSAGTVYYHLYTDANFGTYYNGWHTIGAESWTFTITVPALAKYTITYKANGGTGSDQTQDKYHGKNVTLKAASTFSRSGYKFKQWNTKSDGTGTSYAAEASFTGNSNTTLYAIWTPNTYDVKYYANGGSGTTSAQTKTHGVALTLRSNGFTRANYVFKNWNTVAGGTGTSYSAGASYTGNAALNLYAQWYAPYTVAYNKNTTDTVSDLPSSQTKVHNTSLTLSSTRPTRTGYNFLRWNTATGGTGTNYSPGATYTANAAATLYAQWEVAHYAPTITSLTVQRCNSDGALNAEGTCCKVTCEWSVDNTTAGYTTTTGSKMRVKVGSFDAVETDISGLSGTTEYVYTANTLSIANPYTVTVTIVDTASANNSTSRSATITRAFFTMHFKDGGTGIGIGKVSTTDNLLDIGMTTRFNELATVQATTSSSTAYDSENPKIRFSNANASQNGDLVFTDYDAIHSGATLAWITDQTQSWFHTQYIYATGSVYSNANHYIQDTIADTSSATNGVSSNTYRNYSVLDKNSRYASYLETTFKTDGSVNVGLSARNFGTGANVNNGINLSVANDGTLGVSVTTPYGWRNALGASSGSWPQSLGGTGRAQNTANRTYWCGRILYDNNTGTNGTVTLAETAANFAFMFIGIRSDSSQYTGLFVRSPNGKTVTLACVEAASSYNYVKTRKVSISGTSISGTTSTHTGLSGSVAATSSANEVYITHVIGFV